MFDLEQENRTNAPENITVDGDIRFSIVDVVGKKNNYGKGVYLDTDRLDGVKPRNWNIELAKFVDEKLAGKSITVFDDHGNEEVISFAKSNERVKKDGAKNSHKVIDKLKHTSGNTNTLGIIHIDELLQTAKQFNTSDDNTHQWMDEKGWAYKKAYLQDINGVIYETTLNIARARDGRNILYALANTKKVDDGVVSSASNEEGLAHKHQLSGTTIPQRSMEVKKKISGIVGDKVSARFGVRNPEEYRAINKIAKDLGIKVIFEELDGEDGYYDPKTGELHINIYAENPLSVIKKHEITHILEGTEEYNELITFTKENMSEEWAAKEKEITDLYERVNKKRIETGKDIIELTPERLESEVMAELSEQFVSDKTLEKISRENPSLMEKAIDFIREIVARFKGIFSSAELSVYQQAEQKWLAAYEAVKNKDLVLNETESYGIIKEADTKRSKTTYNEYRSNAMIWARSAGTQPGDRKVLNANGRYFALIEATDDGYVELKKGTYKEVMRAYEKMHRGADDSFYAYTEKIGSEQNRNMRDMQYAGHGGNDAGNGGQTESQGFQDDTAGDGEHLRRSDKGASERLEDTNTKKHKLQDPDREQETFAEYIVRMETENVALKKANASLKELMNIYNE